MSLFFNSSSRFTQRVSTMHGHFVRKIYMKSPETRSLNEASDPTDHRLKGSFFSSDSHSYYENNTVALAQVTLAESIETSA